jgi:hypothetical protein
MESTRKRFAEAVKQHGGPIKAAGALGCSRSFVDMIIDGKRGPGMTISRAIEAIFGIKMQDWVPEPRVEKARRIA